MMRCWFYRKLLASHWPESWEEGLPGVLRLAVSRHVACCADCGEQWQQLHSLGRLLRRLSAPSVPADLELQIRLRLSYELNRSQQPSWGWRWGNRLAPFALPGAMGVLLAVLTFASFLPMVNPPVRADSSDVPLALRTPARLRSSELIFLDPRMESLVVQLLIDQNGRVADCQILDGNYTTEDLRLLRNLLLFTVLFDPATVFGQPTPDTVVLPLRDVSASFFFPTHAG
ncbi:MAG: hypothetical protein A3H27_15970 [Acidobacteria bacterium RIFCSPLOWO2_02_FULL_59_13]|nr:MAG: hypothetical protein A3H27_15970 [Acidobacteria bacterium RIFCSPLOWO2_02_FULL_59_13]